MIWNNASLLYTVTYSWFPIRNHNIHVIFTGHVTRFQSICPFQISPKLTSQVVWGVTHSWLVKNRFGTEQMEVMSVCVWPLAPSRVKGFTLMKVRQGWKQTHQKKRGDQINVNLLHSTQNIYKMVRLAGQAAQRSAQALFLMGKLSIDWLYQNHLWNRKRGESCHTLISSFLNGPVAQACQ